MQGSKSSEQFLVCCLSKLYFKIEFYMKSCTSKSNTIPTTLALNGHFPEAVAHSRSSLKPLLIWVNEYEMKMQQNQNWAHNQNGFMILWLELQIC